MNRDRLSSESVPTYCFNQYCTKRRGNSLLYAATCAIIRDTGIINKPFQRRYNHDKDNR